MKVTFWNCLTDTIGTLEDIDWEPFAVRMTTRREFAGLDKHPGWSAAEFRNNKRNRESVVAVSALCLDFDESATIGEARKFWSGYRGLLQTTKSHTQEKHSFRVVLPLARPVSAFEFDALWLRAQEHCNGSCDRQAKDPSRFWYQPGTLDGGHWFAEIWDGQELDPDEWLARPLKQALPVNVTREPTRTPVTERARRYVAKMDPAISGSRGHDATYAVAIALVRGFDLPTDEAFGIMWSEYNPRCQPPWSEKEIRHKVESADASSSLPRGYLLENDNYRPASQSVASSTPFYEREDAPDVPKVEPEKQDKTPAERLGVLSIADICKEVFRIASIGKREFGCPTGVEEFDMVMGGMRRGNVTVLGAPTSWGKSSFALMASDESIFAGKKVLFLPFEDSALMYGRRLVARRGNINALHLRDCTHDARELKSIANVTANAEQWPFLLNCIGKPVEWAAKAIRFLSQQIQYDLIVVDYIQRARLERKTQDRRNEVTDAMCVLSDAIKNNNAAGLILSQLKRIEGRLPTLEDLKESGDIENMAEHVILGAKMRKEGSDIQFERHAYVAKNKDGPLLDEIQLLQWNSTTASFTATTMRDEFGDIADNVPSRTPSAANDDYEPIFGGSYD